MARIPIPRELERMYGSPTAVRQHRRAVLNRAAALESIETGADDSGTQKPDGD